MFINLSSNKFLKILSLPIFLYLTFFEITIPSKEIKANNKLQPATEQDLYLYNHLSKTDHPLITYEWFPKKIKKLFKNYSYPLFPEDFAYYLLNDNNTLILVSGKKSFNQNLQYNIKNNELNNFENSGKLNFIISSYAKICGYKSHDNNFECKLQKPLVSKNLIN